MSEFIGSYENQVLDAINIVVQAAIQSAGYDRTISATIMECIDSERGLYKVRYQDAIYTASAEDPSKKYAQNSQVYVLIPENDYSKHKRIIGTASELGEDYTAAITENPYKVLGGNCALMTKELSFSSYKGTDEYVLYSSKGNITNSISIDKETFLSYVKDASKIKIGMDFKTFILKAQEGGVYGLQIIFTEKNIENQNEPLRKLVSLTNFDMIGHPYCSLDWGFQSIEFEINPERFIEIEEIKFFLQGFKEDKDKEEIPDIYIKDFFLAGLAHQDSTALNTYYLDIIAPANRVFTEGKDTLEMTADLSFRGETVVSTPPVKYYWFRENAAVKVESVPIDQKPLYHIYAGEGWECLNPYTFVTEEVEVNGVKETKITGGNWESLTTYSITSQNLKNVRYRCIAYFKDKIAGVKDIEITNNNPKYDLELISSDGNFNFYDNLGSKKLTLKLNKVAEENKNFEVEWGALDSSKLYSAIETIKVEDNQSSLTIYGRDINIEKRYFATLFEIEEEKKELIGTVSVNVTNEILSKESTYSVRIRNGEQVFIYDEGGYAPNHISKTNPQVIIPLEFSLFDQDGKEIEIGEGFEIGVQWRLPQDGTLLTDTGSDNTALTYSFGIASLYSKDKTNNTIILEVLYKDKIYKDYTNFTFLKDGNSGTNGTGAFGKISFATDLNGEYPLLLQTSNNEFILNGNNINTNNSQLAVSIWNNGIETPSEKIKKITWRLNTVGEDETKHQSYYTVDTGAVVLKGNDFTYLDNANIEKDHYIFSIVQAEVEYEDTASTRRKLFTEMPICLARSYQEGYSIRMKKGSGFNEVLYLNDGTSPQYASNPFEVEVLYNGTIFSDPKLSYKWRADGIKKNLIKLTNKNSNIESHLVDSLTRYDGLSLDLGITVIAYLDTQPIATLFFPINFLINKYGYAALNDWDGHSIQIKEKGGYILTPQVGAGSKDEDNGFTGVLMGEVKTSPKTESGLFGYSKGQRTFFLDAESGRAEFGQSEAGQIIIDPDEKGINAYIRGGNYSTTNGTGMEINLNKPYIKFGSGKFEVNDSGVLTAEEAKIKGTLKAGAGSEIGPWNINENSIWKGNSAYKANGKGNIYFGNSGLSFSNNFYIEADTSKATFIDGESFSQEDNDGDGETEQNTLLTLQNAEDYRYAIYIKPNKIVFKDKGDKKDEYDFTGGSLSYFGGKKKTADEGDTIEAADINYFYFSKPLKLPFSNSLSSKDIDPGMWGNAWHSIKGKQGIPLITQSYMNNYEINGQNFNGFVLSLGPSYKHGTQAIPGEKYGYRQTVVRGVNVHMMASDGNDGGGYLNIKGNDIRIRSSNNLEIAVPRVNGINANTITIKGYYDQIIFKNDSKSITLKDILSKIDQIITALGDTNGKDKAPDKFNV